MDNRIYLSVYILTLLLKNIKDFMNATAIIETNPGSQAKAQPISFEWLDNPDIRRLLDIISSIIAQEYIQIAKQNPEIFKKQGEVK